MKVLLDEQARAGLNEEVREAIPGSVDVIIAEPRTGRPENGSTGGPVAGRPAGGLLASKGVDDPGRDRAVQGARGGGALEVRPQRLVMEGFLAYRHRTEIDFTDADLFVLPGPTDSGKSKSSMA